MLRSFFIKKKKLISSLICYTPLVCRSITNYYKWAMKQLQPLQKKSKILFQWEMFHLQTYWSSCLWLFGPLASSMSLKLRLRDFAVALYSSGYKRRNPHNTSDRRPPLPGMDWSSLSNRYKPGSHSF